MAGPLFTAAGAEAVRHFSGRRRRRADQLAAQNAAATSYQTARAALLGAMTQPELSEQFEGLREQIAALDANELRRVKAVQRGLIIRRGMALAALSGVIGAGMWTLKEAKSLFHIPVTVTNTQEYGSALLKVEQLTDKRLVRGTGTGSANMSLRVKVGPLTIPGAIAGEDAHMTLPRTEEVSLRRGGTRVERVNINGQERVLVLVDPRMVDAEITGNQEPLAGSGASVGAINSIFQAVGLDRGAQATAYQSVMDMSAQAFSATASHALTQPEVLASLAASDVRNEMIEVAGGVPAETRRMLLQAAAGRIYVEFANLSGAQAPQFIPPAQEQSHIPLPEAPTATSLTLGHVVMNMTPDTSRLESVDAANSLAEIVNTPGYELLYQPVGV